MGLFGRDERTTETKPAAQAPAKRQQPPTTAQAAGITVIARANRVEGTIIGSGDIQIEGELQGGAEGSGHVRIAERGVVVGTIRSRFATVSGTVRGDITASETIQLDATANVEGNITAPKIRITEGATYQGQVRMKETSDQGASKTEAPTEAPAKE